MNRKLVQKDNSTVRVLYISKDEHGGYGVDIGYRFVCLARTSISAIGGRCISLRCGIMYVLYCIHSSLSRLCLRAQKVAHLVENSPKGGNFCSRCFSGHSYSLMAALVKQISRSQSRISSRSYTRSRVNSSLKFTTVSTFVPEGPVFTTVQLDKRSKSLLLVRGSGKHIFCAFVGT